MGGHPYFYYVSYNPDIQAALEELRSREFKAGRYNPVMRNIDFPITPQTPAPGAKHKTIHLALEAAGEEGTRSILDISTVSDSPDFFCAAPLSEEELDELFGTTEPDLENVDGSEDLSDRIERGQCIYVICYKNGKPDGIYFTGYSFD